MGTRLAAAALLLLMAGRMLHSMLGESDTFDEPVHIASGIDYLDRGIYEMNREHPPLPKLLCALTPYLLGARTQPRGELNYLEHSKNITANNHVEWFTLLQTARLASVAAALVLALAVFLWVRRAAGGTAALVSLLFVSCEPNLLAHGHYVTSDVWAALGFFLAVIAWDRYLDAPAWHRLLWAGLALGFALLTKFSTLLLLPVLVALVIWRRKWREAAALPVVAALAFPLILLAYAGDVLSFWQGAKWVFEHNQGGHHAYLLGSMSDLGRWQYFPIAFLVKSPLALLAAAALVLVRIRVIPAALWIPALLYWAASIAGNLNIGIRHLLPAQVFLCAATGIALARFPRKLWLALAALLVLETAAIHPYYTPFYNWAAGGADNGYRYLLDSNTDWGQNLIHVRDEMRAGRLPPVICFGYFGNGPVAALGIGERSVPTTPANDCVVVISPNYLFGVYVPPEMFAWLRERKPDRLIGHSLWVYDLRSGSK